MKVIVMGAGVIGVTTAWYLARAGAEVTVLDRQTGPGLETSYANAGELSYGMTSPWAAPGIPKKAIQWNKPAVTKGSRRPADQLGWPPSSTASSTSTS